MNERSRAFVRSAFRNCYQGGGIVMPLKFEKREWGFIFFDSPGMRRHKSFSTRREAIDYLRGEVPRHVYYSSAIYSNPSAPRMVDKGWEGAELIFDLDADHLHVDADSFEEMLAAVKKETKKLLNFLEDDFGFSEDDIEIVFSGGRGYHVHIYHPKVWGLQSPERREILDYITARGLDIDRIITTDEYGNIFINRSTNWGKRIHQGFIEFMKRVSKMKEEEAIRYLKSIKGIGDIKAKQIFEATKSDWMSRASKEGELSWIKNMPPPRALKEELLRQVKVELGEVDEPVTADIKRLIRLPGSLHGGTGLRVTPLTSDEFEGFDPLVDAVAFDGDKILVDLYSETSIKLGDENYSLDSGMNEVPQALGLFLICRGMAEFKGVV
ncbi:MAG: DNA primase catalytic subunit PriS [Candidatus Syntrophoarchaeum sp.]|nr:DNA primase catalytic subunit PriS [Candidatus Syntrophoarchaeum sp.]